MLGRKRIPSREGFIKIVMKELYMRMVVTQCHEVTCYNRSGHHVSCKEFDVGKADAYKGVELKSGRTVDKKVLWL